MSDNLVEVAEMRVALYLSQREVSTLNRTIARLEKSLAETREQLIQALARTQP